MEGDVKPKPTFRFRRPWESPPKEEDQDQEPEPLPAQVFVPNHSSEERDVKMFPPSSDNEEASSSRSKGEEVFYRNNDVNMKIENQTTAWAEEVEVFSFDRNKLVLTSEKVRVKRESCEITTSPPNPFSIEALVGSSSSSSRNHEGEEASSSRTRDFTSVEEDIKVKIEPEEEDDEKSSVVVEAEEDESIDVEELNDSDLDEEDEDDVDDESDEDGPGTKLRLDEEFPEGRNKERKNSKWADYGVTRKSNRLRSSTSKFCSKAHEAQILKKLTCVLKKKPEEFTEDDKISLEAFPELAEEAKKRLVKRQLASERVKEEEDPEDVLDKKCVRLAQVIAKSRYLVLYTGAGISTSASIPDYRGPNGIWTLLRKGQSIADDLKQFPQSADPTLTHMAIKQLYDEGVIKHIVSQNVDGLHLRSGIPKTALSEVHGNMYIEVCLECHREYVRLFDVTEKTRRHHHKTGRFCYHCGSPLKDSVVLFGEKGSLRWPINWAGAEYNVDKADVILCLGSSLKVLRRYPWLWSMSKPTKQRPKLYIVNLQWTPKDKFAALKINGRCDEVIAKVMDNLKVPIPAYKRDADPIFSIATLLHPSELDTKFSKDLTLPEGFPYPQKSTDLQNYIRFEPVFCKEVRALNQVKRKIVDGEEDDEKDSSAAKSSPCGIGWLGNALSKPKKKKLK